MMGNKKFTLIDAGYLKSTGISFAVIEYKGKRYEANVKLHEDDKDKASKFAGCRFAEQKAQIKALKDELRTEKIKCNAVRNFVKSIECCKKFDKNSPSAKAVYRQLNICIRNVNQLIVEINLMLQDYEKNIRQRDMLLSAIIRKKGYKEITINSKNG